MPPTRTARNTPGAYVARPPTSPRCTNGCTRQTQPPDGAHEAPATGSGALQHGGPAPAPRVLRGASAGAAGAKSGSVAYATGLVTGGACPGSAPRSGQ